MHLFQSKVKQVTEPHKNKTPNSHWVPIQTPEKSIPDQQNLRNVPRLGLRDRDDHPLQIRSEDDLASEPGMLVELPIPGIPPEDVLLVVGLRRELLEPFLGDVDLALGGAGVDVFKAVGGGVDEVVVGESFEEGVAGEPDDLALLSIEIDGEDLDEAIGDFVGMG